MPVYSSVAKTFGPTMPSPGRWDAMNETDREEDLKRERVNAKWTSYVSGNSTPDELKSDIREDLMKYWQSCRIENFRLVQRIRWTSNDHYLTLLEDKIGKVEPRKSRYKYLCNKPTAVYWLQSGQMINAYGERNIMPTLILGAIYEEWLRCHKNEPNIDYGHFFANPVRITSTGPTTICGVIDAHLSLCKQAARLLHQSKSQSDKTMPQLSSDLQRNQSPQFPPKDFSSLHGKRSSSTQGKKLHEKRESRFPKLPAMSTEYEHYSIQPLYCAIVVILDNYRVYEGNDVDSDGYLSLRKFAKNQNVLVARTGQYKGLSAPISFRALREQSLPLGHFESEAKKGYVEVVRVSLAAAVQFITDLELREERAILKRSDNFSWDPRLRTPSVPKGFEGNPQVCKDPDAWAGTCIQAAEEHGYDNVRETWALIRRVPALKDKEDFQGHDYMHYIPIWKTG